MADGTRRLRFILDGDDRLSRILNRAGDSSARLNRRLNDDMNSNSRAVRGFFQSTDGRLRDLRGRFLSTEEAQRRMAAGIPVINGRLADLGDSSGRAATSLGSSGGGLGGSMGAVAGIAAGSLLPAIGALIPMMVGAGAAVGTLKLGFSGVGDALAAAGDKKEFAKQLKALPAPAREFTKSLVSLKKEFGGFSDDIQKAMLPGFTKAVKAAGPVVKILGKSMTELGGAFGDAAEGVGRLLKDSGFQDSLQTNLRLGTGFIKQMTGAFGPFTKSLLDFGAASGPTLKAFGDGFSGLLTKGLPGFFQGLTPGIGGAAKMLDGLFGAVNKILPALGRLSGEMGRTLGPVFAETFKILGGAGAGAMDALGGAIRKLEPVFRDVTFGLKDIIDFGKIVGPTLADTGLGIASAFAPIGESVDKGVGPLQRLNQIIRDNKGAIQEGARIFGVATLQMVSAAIQAAPGIIKAFKYISVGVLTSIDVVVSSTAKLFGWMPGIGPKLKKVNAEFDKFKAGYLGSLDAAEKKATEFASSSIPRLSKAQLKLNIDNWKSQIDTANAKLKTVPPSKQAALKATIADLQAKVAQATRDLNKIDGRVATTRILTIRETRAVYSTVGRPTKGEGGVSKYAAGGAPEAGELAMVGENGPELVVFGQAARVFDATTTKGILGGPLGAAGADAGRGLTQGILGSLGAVQGAAARMAAAVTTGIRTELQIASPSKKMQALAKDIGNGLIVGLTGSRDKIKSVSADLAKDIRTAFSGRKESSLIAYVNKQTTRLLDAASKRDKIAATIATAKAYASDITNAARQGGGLANLGMDAEQVTAGGIKAGLSQKLAQVNQFVSYIKNLAGRGINKSLLRQIIDMGPDAGLPYASALVGADKATLSSISKLETDFNNRTTDLGRLGADVMYDAGKNASKGFLAGLQAQQADIEKTMIGIAKAMQKSIKKALGIRSPSRVMAQLGTYSTQGLARGLLEGVPDVDRSLNVVAGRVAATRPVIGRPAVAGGSGGASPIYITIHGAYDPEAVAKQLQQKLLALKRHQGANVRLGIA
ncbi:hypothetical protein MBT84_32880 [Streptomyces sp. MBT84]|uniref:phage scaffolding protein n=1 Tax=Streptomyces sp. MBT84 TaxID=1488414 RepID=UPI001C6EAD22|nr:phage scaffolding protein [Streptomyces sp. MBT84]MBW8704405.1 hypothetical protein [Streptomyces sp. MBT84]